MKQICLYFDKNTLDDSIISSLFWNFLSEKICVQIQIEDSLKLLIGNSSKANKNFFINFIAESQLVLIKNGFDIFTKQNNYSFTNSPVTVSSKFIELANDFLIGKINKDLYDNKKNIFDFSENIKYFSQPWLDYICNLIHLSIKENQVSLNIPYLKVNFWQRDKLFGVGLSHDVDHIQLRKTFLLSAAKFWFSKQIILPFSFY